MSLVSKVARFTGRLALAPLFVLAGLDAARDPGRRPELVEQAGLPAPQLLVRLNGAAMVLGGLGLLVPRRRRAAAGGLLVSLAATTVVGHPFWREDGPARALQRTQFLKNLGLLGGLLLLLGTES